MPHEYLHLSQHGQVMIDRLLPGDAQVTLESYFDAVTRCRTTANGVFGLKAHFNQAIPHFKSGFMAHYFGELKFIVVKRRDRLGQAISGVIAEQTGSWTSLENQKASPVYDSQALETNIGSILYQEFLWERFLEVNSFSFHTVFYEDLVENTHSTLNSLASYLGEELGTFDPAMGANASGLTRQADATNVEWRQQYEDNFILV